MIGVSRGQADHTSVHIQSAPVGPVAMLRGRGDRVMPCSSMPGRESAGDGGQ